MVLASAASFSVLSQIPSPAPAPQLSSPSGTFQSETLYLHTPEKRGGKRETGGTGYN